MKEQVVIHESKIGPIVVQSMDDGRNVKCPRCWKWHGVKENFDGLCDRCQTVILADYPGHESAPFIRAALDEQRVKYAL